MRFELPKAAFRKLCRLVKQRDEELAETYQSIIGEWPPSRGEVHHAKHAGSGGPDKEDNLIHLSYETHRFKAHGLSGTRKQYMDEQIKTYLNCHAVKEWRKEHEMELQELYKTEEERRIKKKRAGCIPKKPIGWLIEETPDKEWLIPQKEMPVFFMDKNNTYTSSGGRKFKIIKNPRGRWIVQSGDRKERVSIEWQL
jgi:hypothetical protein